MPPSPRIPGFRGEFQWELEIAERQLKALAEGIPASQYDWRPSPDARSVSEVFVHVATGNFMLLDAVGWPPPAHLYGEISGQGMDRMWVLVRRNDELGRDLRDKEALIHLLHESLDAVNERFSASSEEALERSLQFFGEDTTVRRLYLRALTHMHEHMGQLIAYTRSMGLPAPWPDWRPDRR